jgi:hypothetical protein
MALPKIDVPIYEAKLISTGKTVRFRPFSVKEEKIFLMANEGEDVQAIIDATKQVLGNCILDDIDIETLPVFDIENIFLNIRARSVGEIINLRYKCNNDIKNVDSEETHKCNNVVDIELNVLGIEPTIDEKNDKKIEITNKMGFVMKFPSLKMLRGFSSTNEVDAILDVTVSCIDYIYDDDKIYYAKDSTKEELVDFVESLMAKDLEKIKNFFDTMPKIKKDVEFKCNKCGHEETIQIEGIESFFV